MIHVVWHEEYREHGRSRYGCLTMLNEAFDLMRNHTSCVHWGGFANLPKDAEGAVVVIHGGNEYHGNNQITRVINAECERLRWVIFIIIGDEGCEFPSCLLDHPNSRLWVQTPKPGKVDADRYLIVGYQNDCHEMVAKAGRPERDLDWFFAGQDTHERRHQCLAALRSLPNGHLMPTPGFGQGIAHDMYFGYMARAKVIPCPSGPATPDTYRMAEALEVGAVPVIDAVSLDGREGYWAMVFGDHPLPMVRDWSEFPEKLSEILVNYDKIQRLTQFWWKKYKMEMRNWLAKDLIGLGAV